MQLQTQAIGINSGCEIAVCQVPNSRPKMGNWHTKKYLDGLANKRENCKPKCSWIAKTNSDDTPNFFPISCLVITSVPGVNAIVSVSALVNRP